MRLLAAAILCAGCLEAPPSGPDGPDGGGGLCGTAGALHDDFTGTELDTSLWNGTGDVSASGGLARIIAGAGEFNTLQSQAQYLVSGSRLVAELDVAQLADAILHVDLHSSDDSEVGITLQNGELGLRFFDPVAGERTVDAATLEQDHVWLHLREEAGQFFWATSADGGPGVIEHGPFEGSIGALAQVEFDMVAGDQASNLIVHAVNQGSSVPYCAAASFSDDFTSPSSRWQEDEQGDCEVERDGQATLGYSAQAFCALTTRERFDLQGSSFAVELAEVGDCKPEPIVLVVLTSGREVSIKCRDDGGSRELVAADGFDDISQVPYQPELQRFVQLRHDPEAGNLVFEAFDDGEARWNTFGVLPMEPDNLTRTFLRFYLGGETSGGFESVTFDSFNLAP